LKRKGYNVQVATLNHKGPLHKKIIEYGIAVKVFDIVSSYYTTNSIKKILRLAGFIRKEKFDIVQTYGYYSTVPGVIAAKLAFTKTIIAGKRDMNEMLTPKKIFTEKLLWKFCNKIVVNAERIRQHLVDHEHVNPENLTVIYNGVDTEVFRPNRIELIRDQVTVGMIANFRKQKDHETFLLAAKRLYEEDICSRFYLVGSGIYENRVKNLCNRLGLGDAVIFTGTITGSTLLDIYNKLSILVLSSTNEGVPNVILEAMAMGIPVIANPSGGVPELLDDGNTGFLFPFKDVDSLTGKIKFLLSNGRTIQMFQQNAIKRVSANFTRHIMLRNIEGLYANCIRN